MEWHLDQTSVHPFFSKQMKHRRICFGCNFCARIKNQRRFFRRAIKKPAISSLINNNCSIRLHCRECLFIRMIVVTCIK